MSDDKAYGAREWSHPHLKTGQPSPILDLFTWENYDDIGTTS